MRKIFFIGFLLVILLFYNISKVLAFENIRLKERRKTEILFAPTAYTINNGITIYSLSSVGASVSLSLNYFPMSEIQGYEGKSIGSQNWYFKVRPIKEKAGLPAIALGYYFQDPIWKEGNLIGNTFGSAFIVASKDFNLFRVHCGALHGRMLNFFSFDADSVSIEPRDSFFLGLDIKFSKVFSIKGETYRPMNKNVYTSNLGLTSYIFNFGITLKEMRLSDFKINEDTLHYFFGIRLPIINFR